MIQGGRIKKKGDCRECNLNICISLFFVLFQRWEIEGNSDGTVENALLLADLWVVRENSEMWKRQGATAD